MYNIYASWNSISLDSYHTFACTCIMFTIKFLYVPWFGMFAFFKFNSLTPFTTNLVAERNHLSLKERLSLATVAKHEKNIVLA